MLKYAIAFFVAMIMSATFVNYQGPASPIPVGLADVKATSLGVWKRREGLIPEVKVTGAFRKYRYMVDVNNKNENRDADGFGNE